MIVFAKRIKSKLIHLINSFFVFVFRHMKMKKRAFFYTIRSDGELLENARFVFDALNCEKVVFAKMLPHSYFDTVKVKRLMLTSKVIVTDDYLKYLREVKLREGQKLIQLWHACGAFKKFGLDVPSRLTEAEERATHSQYTDVCVSSEDVRKFYAQAFGVDVSVVKALGVPRTDRLLDTENTEKVKKDFFEKHPDCRGKKIYTYFPTFREKDGALLKYDPRIDWAALENGLNDDELFFVSRHPVEKEPFFENKYEKVRDFTEVPTSMLLIVSDVVTTDYSSVIFDAGIMDKPLVFYCPDYDSYERDFYLDFENDLPGKMVKDPAQLLSSVRSAVNYGETDEKLKCFKEKELSACDGKSTARIASMIEAYLQ